MSTATDTEVLVKLKKPNLYKVVLLNDDFTPMDFVMQVLMEIFGKSGTDAHAITMAVHDQGRGVVATYTREIAEQKVQEVNGVARQWQHPLKAIIETA